MRDVADRRGSPDRGKLLAVERRALFDYLLFGLFVLMMPAAFGSSADIFSDGDVSWHLAAGNWILDNGRIPNVDPFSLTMGGQPWVAFEWLSQVIYAAAFSLAGYAGVAATVTVALIGLNFIALFYLRRRTGPLGILLALVAMNLVLVPFTLARPHVLVWPVLATWTAMVLRAREEQRPPSVWMALLMIAWTNLHGSFPIGLVIAAAIGLDAVIESRWDRRIIMGWLSFGLLSAGAALLNANGISGILHPFTVAGLDTLTLIQEWQPSIPAKTPWFFAVFLAALGAIMSRGVRLRVGELALLLLMLAMAFYQVRHQSWLAIVAALILPPILANTGQRGGVRRNAFSNYSPIHLAAAAGLAFVLVLGRAALPMTPAENGSNPRQLLAAVPDDLRNQPVLNGYSFGGPLILSGIRPYIDGRSDMYGDEFFSDYQEIVDGDARRFRRAVDRYGIRWTMLPYAHKRLIEELDNSPEWRRLYADTVGVIHVRMQREGRTGGEPPPSSR